jgi:putative transposase
MSYWRLFYHFVWTTREREPLIPEEWQKRLHGAKRAELLGLGAFVHAVGGTEDHVHMVASVPPTLSLAQFVGQVKGASSHLANRELSPTGGFAWQAEYGVVSFGGRQLARAVGYVLRQREHHQDGTVVPGLERVGTEPAARDVTDGSLRP